MTPIDPAAPGLPENPDIPIDVDRPAEGAPPRPLPPQGLPPKPGTPDPAVPETTPEPASPDAGWVA